jgi:hypothetical protein
VTTKEPLRYDFNHFTFASRLVRKGSRLELILAAANSIQNQRILIPEARSISNGVGHREDFALLAAGFAFLCCPELIFYLLWRLFS